MLAVVAVLVAVLQRRDDPRPVGGNFAACVKLEGHAARACYNREVGREQSPIGVAAPNITLAAPAGTGEVTFTSADAARRSRCCASSTRASAWSTSRCLFMARLD